MSNLKIASTLYRDILLREPDEAGVKYWASTLDNGTSNASSIINSFVASVEFQEQIRPIIDLYTVYLLRAPDSEGLAYWVNEQRNGLPQVDTSNNFEFSTEAEEIANLDDSTWLTRLYEGVLSRAPDPEGFAYWLILLADGMTREDLASTFIASNESTEQLSIRTLTPLLSNETVDSSSMNNIKVLLNNYIERINQEASEPPVEPGKPAPSPPPLTPNNPTKPGQPDTGNPDFNLGERYHTGTSDASAAISVGDNLMLIADDEDQILRLYERDSDGSSLAEIDLNNALGLNDTQEVDLEAVATYQGTHYWLGSHENSQRSMIFSTNIIGDTAESLNIEVTGQFTGLASQLSDWDVSNGHGLGINALNLSSGVNIEGASFIGDALYLGLRSPLDNGFAQVILVDNVIDLVSGEADTATFGTPLRLDLDGRAVRSIEPAGDDGYLLLAGPVDDIDAEAFGLYLWDGAHAVREIEGVNLNTLPDTLTAKPESIFDINITNTGASASVLFDSGTADWLDNGQDSKDLSAELQRFVSTCRVPDDQMSYRSYPLLAARELLQQFIREQVHGHQAA